MYRIVLHNKWDNHSYVIAVSGKEIHKFSKLTFCLDSIYKIEEHWKYLLENLLPHVYSLKDSTSNASNTNSTSQVGKLNVKTLLIITLKPKKAFTEVELTTMVLEPEIIQYLFSKVSSLAQVTSCYSKGNLISTVRRR